MEKFCPFNLTREEMLDYTREWSGERFDDQFARTGLAADGSGALERKMPMAAANTISSNKTLA